MHIFQTITKQSKYKYLHAITFLLVSFLILNGCSKNKDLNQNRPLQAEDKRKRNIEEGKGASLGGLMRKARGGTNYEFSTSNPMWRASLETLDFLPLSTVDYSGGIIITDWYSDNNSSNQESIKISIRFLSNELMAESLKVIVHKKTCASTQNCKVVLLSNSKIKDELYTTILRRAALLQKETKNKKKK
jgi:hypothetical protein